jgi:hypothetical protein
MKASSPHLLRRGTILVDHLGIEPSKDGLQGLPALQRAAQNLWRGMRESNPLLTVRQTVTLPMS